MNAFGSNVIFADPSFGYPTRATYSSFTRVIKLKTYFLDLFKGAVRYRTGSKIVFYAVSARRICPISIDKNIFYQWLHILDNFFRLSPRHSANNKLCALVYFQVH